MVCMAVEFVCSSSPMDYAENIIAKRVKSEASAASEQAILDEIDDHYVHEATVKVDETIEVRKINLDYLMSRFD